MRCANNYHRSFQIQNLKRAIASNSEHDCTPSRNLRCPFRAVWSALSWQNTAAAHGAVSRHMSDVSFYTRDAPGYRAGGHQSSASRSHMVCRCATISAALLRSSTTRVRRVHDAHSRSMHCVNTRQAGMHAVHFLSTCITTVPSYQHNDEITAFGGLGSVSITMAHLHLLKRLYKQGHPHRKTWPGNRRHLASCRLMSRRRGRLVDSI